MKTFSTLFLCLSLLVGLYGCKPNNKEVMGYQPIYVSANALDAPIASSSARILKNPGKIYYYNSYILVGESGEGIHIIDNANPTAPQLVSFIPIYGNVDMAIKGNYLYVDSFKDLIVLNISNMTQITQVNRIPNAFPNALANQEIPPKDQAVTYFECADAKKGIVVGWKRTILVNPKCKL